MNEKDRPESPRIWNPKADKHLYFYSESLNMNFPVSRLDWSGWYQALIAASPGLDSEDLLAALLRNAVRETRFPQDSLFDMPWYERENYLAEAVITAGWVPLVRKPTGDLSDTPTVAEEPQSQTAPTEGENPADPDQWGSWYANVSAKNPQLDDFHLLGELIHAASFAAQEAGMPEPDQPPYFARAIISAGWRPPTAEAV